MTTMLGQSFQHVTIVPYVVTNDIVVVYKSTMFDYIFLDSSQIFRICYIHRPSVFHTYTDIVMLNVTIPNHEKRHQKQENA
jgi:hypothetical protein